MNCCPAAAVADPLECPEQVRAKIVDLFTTIADESVVTNAVKLWSLGAEIEDTHKVHPFTLLLNMPPEKIRKVFTSDDWLYRTARIPTITWGIEKGMRRYADSLGALLPAFADKMGKDPRIIRQWIERSAWEELVRYLFGIIPA